MHLPGWFGFSFALLAASVSSLSYTASAASAARHGGLLFRSGTFDVELVAQAHGHYTAYFNNTSGGELSASVVSDVSLSLQRAGKPPENLALRSEPGGRSWVGNGSDDDARIVAARLSYRAGGKTEQADVPFSDVFHAELNTSSPVQAGAPTQLTFAVKDFFGGNTNAMQIVHDKPMHVMVVSADLAEFRHIHPVLSKGDVFAVTHVFPNGGDYRVFADFTPVGGGNQVARFNVHVQGSPRASIPLEWPPLWTRSVGSVRMTLSSDKPLQTGQDIGLSLTLADARTGAPVHDLQRYLGAWSHIAIISQDTQDFLHVHAMEEIPSNFDFFWYTLKRDVFHQSAVEPGGTNPAMLRTFAGFRRAGLYKMWVEVRRQNAVLTFPFVLRVAAGAEQITKARVPQGAVLVNVSSAGFQPSRIPARAGQPLRLAFFRADAENCGRVVRFPDLGIERQLPPGQTVLIEVTPRGSGPLAFSCGMNMMKGELLVH